MFQWVATCKRLKRLWSSITYFNLSNIPITQTYGQVNWEKGWGNGGQKLESWNGEGKVGVWDREGDDLSGNLLMCYLNE